MSNENDGIKIWIGAWLANDFLRALENIDKGKPPETAGEVYAVNKIFHTIKRWKDKQKIN